MATSLNPSTGTVASAPSTAPALVDPGRWSHRWRSSGPIPLAQLTSRWSHVTGGRHPRCRIYWRSLWCGALLLTGQSVSTNVDRNCGSTSAEMNVNEPCTCIRALFWRADCPPVPAIKSPGPIGLAIRTPAAVDPPRSLTRPANPAPVRVGLRIVSVDTRGRRSSDYPRTKRRLAMCRHSERRSPGPV